MTLKPSKHPGRLQRCLTTSFMSILNFSQAVIKAVTSLELQGRLSDKQQNNLVTQKESKEFLTQECIVKEEAQPQGVQEEVVAPGCASCCATSGNARCSGTVACSASDRRLGYIQVDAHVINRSLFILRQTAGS